MSISRRDFLTRASRGAIKDLVNGIDRGGLQSQPREQWIAIGCLRDYPCGERRELAQLGLTVDSNSLGLRVCDHSGQGKPARIDPFGKIWIDMAGCWPEHARLSWATGEMVLTE